MYELHLKSTIYISSSASFDYCLLDIRPSCGR